MSMLKYTFMCTIIILRLCVSLHQWIQSMGCNIILDRLSFKYMNFYDLKKCIHQKLFEANKINIIIILNKLKIGPFLHI